MTSYLSVALVALAVSITVSSARVIPAEPLSVMLDPYGNPVILLREKRAPVSRPQLPQRAMMFTGYYRPTRRSYNADQAAGVFAQGNAVSAGSYLGGVPSTHLKNGPEPIDESEISSAQAEAAPEVPEDAPEAYPQEEQQVQEHNDEEQHQTPISNPEPLPYDIDAPAAAGEENVDGPTEDADQSPAPESPAVPSPKPVASPPVKKGKKTPIPEEDDEDEDDLEEEEPYVPFVPTKGNRRQGYVPNLNNFFPMMFSFPGASRRGGSSSGTPPGVVTAIANSYSTGKGGIASSVATAYGGSPNRKKARRAPVPQE